MEQCEVVEQITITRGEDRNFFVRIVNEETGDPYDLSNTTAIEAIFAKDDNTTQSIKLSENDIEIENPQEAGKIKLLLDDTFTGTLKDGDNQSFEIELTATDDTKILQLLNKLNVKERLFA